MKKEDLKVGNVVALRVEGVCLVCEFGINKILSNLDGKHHKHINNIDSANIMKVYEDYTLKNLLWERKEKPKLTEDEKAILRNLYKEFKYIVRDKDGSLYIYHEEKPEKGNAVWSDGSSESLHLFEHLFQFIKWEDEEPYLISDLLKECEE